MTDARDIALRELMRQLDEVREERDDVSAALLAVARMESDLRTELAQVKAERDAALKLVDDTLEAVGHQHDLGLTVCSCGKLMPPRDVDIVVKDWQSPTSQIKGEA